MVNYFEIWSPKKNNLSKHCAQNIDTLNYKEHFAHLHDHEYIVLWNWHGVVKWGGKMNQRYPPFPPLLKVLIIILTVVCYSDQAPWLFHPNLQTPPHHHGIGHFPLLHKKHVFASHQTESIYGVKQFKYMKMLNSKILTIYTFNLVPLLCQLNLYSIKNCGVNNNSLYQASWNKLKF